MESEDYDQAHPGAGSEPSRLRASITESEEARTASLLSPGFPNPRASFTKGWQSSKDGVVTTRKEANNENIEQTSSKMDGGREDQAWEKKGTSEEQIKKALNPSYELSLRERKKEKDEEFKQIFSPISEKLQITWSLRGKRKLGREMRVQRRDYKTAKTEIKSKQWS